MHHLLNLYTLLFLPPTLFIFYVHRIFTELGLEAALLVCVGTHNGHAGVAAEVCWVLSFLTGW